ncbi:MAG: helicase-related protein, partial [Streptococcus sp.]|nr:helicase-related protein [Streptococcus sp.]
TVSLEEKVQVGVLEKHHLARRFHGNPLVIPQFFWQGKLQQSLSKQKLPRPLLRQLKKQRKSKFPLLIFFPNIAMGERFTKILQNYFPEEKIAFVSSKSEERSEMVKKFREQDLTILVTTTILERGVTFPKVDVFVCMANHHLFTSSSLIQIGGRVGRSSERPTGKLYFFHEGLSKSILQCRQEIKAMNRKGGFDDEMFNV